LRAAIFIDGGYLLKQVKNHGVDPDYERLADFFLDPLRTSVPLDLMRCYFYYCAPWTSDKPTDDETRRLETYDEFVEELEGFDRWALRQGKLEKRFDGKKEYFEQKRVDVLLSCDLVRHAAAGHIQHAVLIAGDSDFIPAVEAAKDSGVTITLFTGDFKTVHSDLIILADEVHHFDWKTFPRAKPKQEKKTLAQPRAKKAASSRNGSDKTKTSDKAQRRVDKRRDKSDSYDPADVLAMKKELGLLTGKIKKFIKGE
jgi:uncharacterized LabA/DUF88 family protein